MENKEGLSRREFIKTAGIATAGVVVGSLITDKALAAVTAPASPKVIGANDRINYAVIGVGGMGGAHLNLLTHIATDVNIKVVGVCDVFEKRRLKAKANYRLPYSWTYSDYRKLLENKDIDVVVIATPDHWHAQIAIDAMEAGKHVYVEKPMTRYLDEAFKMQEVAKRTGRTVQVGAQGCSGAKWHQAADIIKSGKIGKIIWAQSSYCRNNPRGEWNYGIDPEANEKTVDWKTWLGCAPKRSWSPERYFRWRKYWDYGTGIIGDLWPHRLYPLMVAMGIEEFPSRVACVGKNICDTDKGFGERRDVADATLLQVEFPSGAMIVLAGSTVNALGLDDVIRGQEANLLLGGNKIQIAKESAFLKEEEAGTEDVPVVGPDGVHGDHHRNLINALRTNTAPSCPIELGVRAQAIVSMAEKSYRESKMMKFDPTMNTMTG